MALVEAIESTYLMWKSEKHGLSPKYDILYSLVTLVNHYFFTIEEDYNKFKITCQHFHDILTCLGRSG